MHKRNIILLIILVCLFNLWGSSAQKEIRSDSGNQKSIHLTIYNSNRALVNETRKIMFPGGLTSLWFQDVAAKIMPQTVAIKGVSGASFRVLEQNYEYDLLSPSKLLEKYLQREVVLVKYISAMDTTREKRTQAKLLSTNNGTVWQIGDQIVINPPYSYLEFPEVPPNLFSKPTLVWLLETAAGEATIAASYLTTDISWLADYVFTLSEDDSQGDMIGWVTINNNSGARYKDAKLKLIAGDVHIAEEVRAAPVRAKVFAEAAAPQFEEKAFFEYHMYTLQRPATVNDRQQKQIELLHADNISVEKHFIVRGQPWYYRQRLSGPQTHKVEVAVQIENSRKNSMGMPLPKGTVRVYKRDADGSSQFIGEDIIDHTPKDEKFFLKLGNAFDVVAERRQIDYKVISRCVYETAYEIKIRNHKTEPANIRVIEPVGGDWEMRTNSHDFMKLDAFTIEFKVPVNPDEEVVVVYRVRTRYC